MDGREAPSRLEFPRGWQVNTLGPFLLARLLMPNLAAAATAAGYRPGSARVIYVGSRLEKRGTLADLELADVRSRFLVCCLLCVCCAAHD